MPRYVSLAILVVFSVMFLGLPVASKAMGDKTAISSSPAFKAPATPHPAGDLVFLDKNGAEIHLAQFRGRLVLLDVWATWCLYCRVEMPALDHLQAMLGPEGLSVVPVSTDQKGVALVFPFYRENNIQTLPMYFDPQHHISQALKVSGIPASILVSRSGMEVGRFSGWHDWTTPESIAFLRGLLRQP